MHRLAKLWRTYSSIHAHTQEGAYSQLVLPATQLLSRHMEAHMGMFEPWDVAISIWAYGLLGVQDEVVLPLLLQRAAELSPLFKPADCTQVLIGLARLGLREAPLLKELTYVILNQLEDIRAQDLSQVGRLAAGWLVAVPDETTAFCNRQLSASRACSCASHCMCHTLLMRLAHPMCIVSPRQRPSC